MARGMDPASEDELEDLAAHFRGSRGKLEGRTEKIRRKSSDPDDEGGNSRRNREGRRRSVISAPWEHKSEPEPQPVVIPATPIQERRSPTPERKERTMTQTQERRPWTPFGRALRLARQITTRRPQDEQPEIFSELRAALRELPERGKDSKMTLTRRLISEAIEDPRSPIGGLFEVARSANCFGLAPNTATVRKAMREGGLTVQDLIKAGLSEVQLSDGGRAYFRYNVGARDLEAAIPLLEEAGKTAAAYVIEQHFMEREQQALLRQAEREFRAKQAAASAQVPTEISEADPAAEDASPVLTEEATPTDEATDEAAVPAEQPKAKRTRKSAKATAPSEENC